MIATVVLRSLLTAALLAAWAPLLVLATFSSEDLSPDSFMPVKTHSISAPYVDSNLQNKFWDFGGDTIIDTSRAVRLTQDRPSQSGWLWSRSPLPARDFQIEIEFKIDGHNPHLFGDGFAMWLTTERAQPGPIFGFKNYFTGIGIIFDTYANTRHSYSFPRVMAVYGNGVEAFVTAQDGANLEQAGCSMDIRRAAIATKARLIHVHDQLLEVQLHYSDWEQWETCFELHNVTAPQQAYLGFTALTGDVSDNHDIVSVETSSIMHVGKAPGDRVESHPAGSRKKASKGRHRNPGHTSAGGGNAPRGFFSTIFHLVYSLVKWCLILGSVGLAIHFGLQYKKKQDAKRF